MAATAVLVATGCGPFPAPTVPGPPAICSVVEQQDIDSTFPYTGIWPTQLPAGIPAAGGNRELRVSAEATSPNGQWHLWAISEGGIDAMQSFRTDRLRIYAQDTTTEDLPVEVASVQPVSGMFGFGWWSLRNGVGYPNDADFIAIDDDGAGFLLAVKYQETHTALEGMPLPVNETGRLLLFGC